MTHFEIVIVHAGTPVRKGIIAADIVTAINKAVALVQGATVEEIDRAIRLGVVDAQ